MPANPHLELALAELDAHYDFYDEAERFYYGRVQEQFASRLMERTLRESGHKFNVNLAKRPVDAVLDRLEISAITADSPTVEQIVEDRIWLPNELDLEVPELHRKAEMYGDAYLFIWDGKEEGTVDVFFNSPKSVRMFYDPEHPRKKLFAAKRWSAGERVRINLYYPDRTEKLVSRKGTKGSKAEDFIPYLDDATDELGVAPNPYGKIPFFHYRTDRPYGRPEHADAFGPQNCVTKLVINSMASSDFSAFPQRYAIEESGVPEDALDRDFDVDETSDPNDLASTLVPHPGEVWLLRNIEKIGEFATTDSSNFTEPMMMYVRLMSTATATPLHYLDPTGDMPSGESQRAADAPLVKKIQARQRSFAATHREAMGFALNDVLGIEGVVTVRWAEPYMTEGEDFWRGVKAKQDAGVPKRQTLLEAGYPEAQVTAWGYTENDPDRAGTTGEPADAA